MIFDHSFDSVDPHLVPYMGPYGGAEVTTDLAKCCVEPEIDAIRLLIHLLDLLRPSIQDIPIAEALLTSTVITSKNNYLIR